MAPLLSRDCSNQRLDADDVHDADVAAHVRGIRMSREIGEASALKEWRKREVLPGPERKTDALANLLPHIVWRDRPLRENGATSIRFRPPAPGIRHSIPAGCRSVSCACPKCFIPAPRVSSRWKP